MPILKNNTRKAYADHCAAPKVEGAFTLEEVDKYMPYGSVLRVFSLI